MTERQVDFNITWKHIAIGFGLVVADVIIYITLGLLLMVYEDNYSESEGEYWSLASMTTSEKITYIALQIWFVINVLGIAYCFYRIAIKLKNVWLQWRKAATKYDKRKN